MKPLYDYSYAAKSGKGTVMYYFVPPGFYEVYEPLSWKHDRRYFVRVNETGDVQEISKEDVLCHLKNAG